MEQLGYSLVSASGQEIQFWGDINGQTRGMPDLMVLPNGDVVNCPQLGVAYPDASGWTLWPRYWQAGANQSIQFQTNKVVVTRPAPAVVYQMVNMAIVRFTVAASVVTVTNDTLGVSNILRVSAGRYRIYYAESDTEKKLIPQAPVILDSLNRIARLTARTATYTEVMINDPLGVAADVAEVSIGFHRVMPK